MNKLVWIIVLLALAALINYTFDNIFKNAGYLYVDQAKQGDQTLNLTWQGEISPPLITQINEAVKEAPTSVRTIVLTLNSPGGLVGYGSRVIAYLNGLKKHFELITYVPNNTSCASMCVPVYLAGEKRLAGSRSRFMFHEVSERDLVTRKRQTMHPDDKDRATRSVFSRFFLPAKVDPKWVANTEKEIKGKDYWRSGRQLMDEKSGIIHRLD